MRLSKFFQVKISILGRFRILSPLPLGKFHNSPACQFETMMRISKFLKLLYYSGYSLAYNVTVVFKAFVLNPKSEKRELQTAVN